MWWKGKHSVEVDAGVAATDDGVAPLVDEGEVAEMCEDRESRAGEFA